MLRHRSWMIVVVFGIAMLAIHCLGAGTQPERAEKLWQLGQKAMLNEETDRAIGFYEQSLRIEPDYAKNHMSLAAAYLEKGQDIDACKHLARYLDAHPEHHTARIFFADLLLRLGRVQLAKFEFQRYLCETEDLDSSFLTDRIHSHRRLMEIAKLNNAPYQLHFHRGLALYLMAQQRAKLPQPDGVLPVEALLCKSAAELTRAHLLKDCAARPCLYLSFVWSKLGQSGRARQYLAQTQILAPFNDLSSAEQRLLAVHSREEFPLSR